MDVGIIWGTETMMNPLPTRKNEKHIQVTNASMSTNSKIRVSCKHAIIDTGEYQLMPATQPPKAVFPWPNARNAETIPISPTFLQWPAGLRSRPMNHIEVQVVNPQLLQGLLAGLTPMELMETMKGVEIC